MDAFPLETDAIVLEIGPGPGALTELLLERFGEQLYAAEIDKDMIPLLQKRFPALGNRLICGDVLKFDLAELPSGPLIICGNFPYNISSQILFKVWDNRDRVTTMIGMFQKEVSDRVMAGPGSKTYGILSVLLAAFYSSEEVVKAPPSAFSPPPKVHSSVIKLVRNQVAKLPCNEKVFKAVVKQAFNQRRKMLRNSLRSMILDEVLMQDTILQRRPEQMSLEDFITLSVRIEGQSET